jgi:hypothetical protein
MRFVVGPTVGRETGREENPMADEAPREMTPCEYAFATPADLGGRTNYRRFCRSIGLQPDPGGWGFLMCESADGERWTRVTADVEYLRMLVSAPDTMLAELEIPAEKFPRTRAGWVDDWA